MTEPKLAAERCETQQSPEPDHNARLKLQQSSNSKHDHNASSRLGQPNNSPVPNTINTESKTSDSSRPKRQISKPDRLYYSKLGRG